MEQPTKLEHLRSSIEGLNEISNELAARSNGWSKDAGDLGAASDLFAEYCKELRVRYEHLRNGSGTLPREAAAFNVGYPTDTENLG